MTDHSKSGTSGRYLVFSLGKDEYSIPLSEVREVIALPEITPVPHSPAHFLGIMNLRGQVISVVDLRLKMGFKKLENTRETAIVIVDVGATQLGAVVSSVNYVASFDPADIRGKPDLEKDVRADHVSGVAQKDGKLIILLDMAASMDVASLPAIAAA